MLQYQPIKKILLSEGLTSSAALTKSMHGKMAPRVGERDMSCPHLYRFDLMAANGEINRSVSICVSDLYNVTIIWLWEAPVSSVIKRSSRLAHKPIRHLPLHVFTGRDPTHRSSSPAPDSMLINHIYESHNYLIRVARWGHGEPTLFITACNRLQMVCEAERM